MVLGRQGGRQQQLWACPACHAGSRDDGAPPAPCVPLPSCRAGGGCGAEEHAGGGPCSGPQGLRAGVGGVGWGWGGGGGGGGGGGARCRCHHTTAPHPMLLLVLVAPANPSLAHHLPHPTHPTPLPPSIPQVAAVHLHHEPFSVENGMMTPTFKLKRPQAQTFFQAAIDGGWRRAGAWGSGGGNGRAGAAPRRGRRRAGGAEQGLGQRGLESWLTPAESASPCPPTLPVQKCIRSCPSSKQHRPCELPLPPPKAAASCRPGLPGSPERLSRWGPRGLPAGNANKVLLPKSSPSVFAHPSFAKRLPRHAARRQLTGRASLSSAHPLLPGFPHFCYSLPSFCRSPIISASLAQ